MAAFIGRARRFARFSLYLRGDAMLIISLCLAMMALGATAFLFERRGYQSAAAKMPSKTFMASSVAVALAFTALIGVMNLRKWAAVRRDYPLESLAERVTFANYRGDDGNLPVDAFREHKQAAACQLGGIMAREDLENEVGTAPSSPLARALAYAHARNVQQFIDAPSFGVGRMTGRWQEFSTPSDSGRDLYINLRLDTPISTPAEATWQLDAPTPEAGLNALELGPSPRDSLADFVNRRNRGWAKQLREAAGFRLRGLSQIPQLRTAAHDAEERWQTTRLELVSLLKHKPPMVYVSERLPRMDALNTAAVRPLDAFERRGIAKLAHGESLVAEAGMNRLRTLGSIFAQKQCQQCHQVGEGELLGAFSYEFVRNPPRMLDGQADKRLQNML
jgi:hypothetical protein